MGARVWTVCSTQPDDCCTTQGSMSSNIDTHTHCIEDLKGRHCKHKVDALHCIEETERERASLNLNCHNFDASLSLAVLCLQLSSCAAGGQLTALQLTTHTTLISTTTTPLQATMPCITGVSHPCDCGCLTASWVPCSARGRQSVNLVQQPIMQSYSTQWGNPATQVVLELLFTITVPHHLLAFPLEHSLTSVTLTPFWL